MEHGKENQLTMDNQGQSYLTQQEQSDGGRALQLRNRQNVRHGSTTVFHNNVHSIKHYVMTKYLISLPLEKKTVFFFLNDAYLQHSQFYLLSQIPVVFQHPMFHLTWVSKKSPVQDILKGHHISQPQQPGPQLENKDQCDHLQDYTVQLKSKSITKESIFK